jgi:hypothetical protein
MKHLLLRSLKFYKTNGLIGMSLKKINQLRGGGDDFGRIAHTELSSSICPTDPLTAGQIDDILADERISNALKKPFRKLREDPMFGDSEKVIEDRLYKSLIAKTKHPFYSKIKGKVPYVILSPFTLSELTRLATYRLAGFTSAPLTISALIGLSMPCAVTFSMLEMYAPEKLKLPCKCAKWTGGLVFYGVCASVDYVTAGIETQTFGEPLPIDAPNLMGTLPKTTDLKELQKLQRLADSIIKKSSDL